MKSAATPLRSRGHERLPLHRLTAHLRRGLTALGLLTALLVAQVAEAGHDNSVEIQFWAFSRDSKYMLVVVKDEARGDALAIKQVGKMASIYEAQLPPGIEPTQLQQYLLYPPFNAYGFADGGVVGEASPDGCSLMTSKAPNALRLYMSRGETMTKLFAIPLGTDPTRTQFAEASLKEVRWASTGKAVALLVHQSMKGDYGMEVDQLISFDPTPYKAKLGPPPAAPAGKAR